MSFIFLVIGVLWCIYLQNRIGKIEERLRVLGQDPHLSSVPKEKHDTHVVSTPPAPPDAPSGEDFRKTDVHVGEMFRVATIPAAPAPMPPPDYHATMEASSRESHEEQTARWLGRIGALAILAGVAFFLKYAFDNDWIGETGRVALGIIGGLAMISVGHYLRAKYPQYSDIVIGGGIGLLYLSLYGAFGFYQIITQPIAFLLMALVTAFGLVLSVTGNSRGLALLSLLGGFLTPVLLSTGTNQLVALSVYLLILNFGVMGMALWKKWGVLNYASFIGTILLFGGWIERFYTDAQFQETFLFVSLFFLVFLATSVLHHLIRKESTTVSDLVLLIANASGYFGVGVWLLEPRYADYQGFFALLLAVLYLGIAYLAFVRNRSNRMLNLFLPGIAVVFLTLAIPLQFSGYYVTLLWFAESIVLVVIGLYLGEKLIRIFGWIVLLVGMLSMGEDVARARRCENGFGSLPFGDVACDVTPFLNMGFFIMCASILTLGAMAALYKRYRHTIAEWRLFALFALVAANILAIGVFVSELSLEHRYLTPLAWEVGALVLLAMSLKFRARLVEVFGWFALFVGGLTIVSHLHDIRIGIPMGGGSPTELLVGAFKNLGFLLLMSLVATIGAFGLLYARFKESLPDRAREKVLGAVFIVLNFVMISAVTSEIMFKYDQEIRRVEIEHEKEFREFEKYGMGDSRVSYYEDPVRWNLLTKQYAEINERYSARIAEFQNSKNTAITIFWALYATLLIAIGVARRVRMFRVFGLIFFFIVAAKVFLDVWQLGQFYRIVSSIVFGTIALIASFLYAKYKDRIKSVVMSK